MRTGACASQQTLSPEAASVLKHSLSLARRRGHAQLTPLHVAATLLTSKSSLFRRACLKSQPNHLSHPLQSRALELCFNVALNRLPATPGGGLLHAPPSLSNALIAALKRAQAHQRRGCIEQQQQQQQPLIAVKVELEQLILSILDDPSVSRVMREAGFSSTSVKNNLEADSSSVSSVFQCYNPSGGIYSTPNSPPTYQTQRDYQAIKEDIKIVLEVLVGKKRRNTVIVGDYLFMAEGIVAELIEKVERGDVPEELKSAKLLKFKFSQVPLKFMTREEVDMNVADLKRKVESFASVAKVIIYIGDLKWAVDGDGVYSPVDHLISEIGKLISWYNSLNYMRVWLIASADYQTYMRCQMKQPPLDVQWGLQAVSVPSGGLGLSLNGATSVSDSRFTFPQNPSQVTDKKLFCLKEDHDVLTCCPECLSNYEKEAAFNSIIKNKENGSAQLPFWLKPHGNHTLDTEDLVQLRRKYNKLCQSLHQGSQIGRNYYYTLSYPNCPNKNNIVSDCETISFACPNQTAPRFRRQQSCHIEFSFNNGSSKNQSLEPNLDSLKSMDSKEVKITLALGNSMYEKVGIDSDILQENVPWQSETIPLILEALMDGDGLNKDKFLLIQGNDVVGKRRLAVGLAKAMFGSSELLFCMNMKNNAKAMFENREMLEKALRNHEKLVVLVEDIDYADLEFVKFLEGREMETMRDSGHVIFILTMEGDTTIYNNTKGEHVDSVIQMKLLVQESKLSSDILHLDRKRKVDWDLPIRRSKNLRNDEMDEVSSNILDLNIKASEDEDETKELKPGEFRTISSDLSRETTTEQHSSLRFLKKIKNCFVLNKNSDKDHKAREMFLSKFKRSFEEASGCRNISSFNVEDKVLEEVLRGSGSYLNNLFDQWLKDIFETSLHTVVDNGDREKISIRLCLGGKGETVKDGFMGTCLPKRILVSFLG
ncbi:Chaperone HSP104 [Handroanthus impetiginosus]|uniref:Chaperone HSP104 n=1 Tax=Handroanthus impetiginosus TaxID=429701 RepID=A0A2G9H0C8_9LAMI|nr:Chaperone HSP104 [Handroanthus impetiginosus]